MQPRTIKGWEFLFTFGESLDVYGFGLLRIGIDRLTGIQRIGYVRR